MALPTDEPGAIISAGAHSLHPNAKDISSQSSGEVDERRIAFGQFVTLARRKKRMTIEQLADESDIDIGELLAIEQHDAHYAPGPRTVYQLATYFDVSRTKLMALAGLLTPKNDNFVQEALKFAARSASVAELSDVEKAVLEGLVGVLSDNQ